MLRITQQRECFTCQSTTRPPAPWPTNWRGSCGRCSTDLGSVAAMRTSTACCDSTSPNAGRCPGSGNSPAIALLLSSTHDRGNAMAKRRPSNGPKSYSKCCTWGVNSPLRSGALVVLIHQVTESVRASSTQAAPTIAKARSDSPPISSTSVSSLRCASSGRSRNFMPPYTK